MNSYSHLTNAMLQRGVQLKDIASVLQASDTTVYKKIHAETSFTFEEAKKIQSELFPDLSLTYLFEIQEKISPY
ncbi:hypothetical protein [Ethanoligenens harbinense]|uniref:XRE family plasmid maintenance system antidote protein n=1 Tax=Ethanoligenens harbinense (strain DSM 18485 / JCM 12961 / CGMCC 1.5033 / YUAN-3) TaxID=663278 RepID=E6U4U2_ETHHY|nr:hypothetical protein [Ethanoligenens harbinense]ADU27827.1 XRE family plasmid maintenance system antidote protein [Ethanoligenens harbinense YUAN-3]AVQ96851.1 transcriptional regulator [Ethanoligenens harbinense YUAN-3]AYF39513.1 transcriptional regulator [Ethanoligenens harbinense]AYF42338.1 transcriptional regulator [Ethanoligenens harbinense]QCN93092.1 XRE family transcriptional regulator [Ethanoligenens harbinense]